MHRVIAGLNTWALIMLVTALLLGLTSSPYHVPVAILATVFAILAQCMIFALFMGASMLLKEHMQLFDLDQSLVTRANAEMIPLFRWATVGSLSVLLVAILGGLGISGDLPKIVHVFFAYGTIMLLGVAVLNEIPRIRAMHDILADMEEAIPEDGKRVPQPYAPGPTELRVRGLVYVGGSVLVAVIGYRFIAGIPIPAFAFWLATGFSTLCLVVAGVIHRQRTKAT